MTRESKPYLTGDYEEMFTAASTGNLSNEEAVAYSQSYLKELDKQSAVRFAERRSYEEGMEKGMEKAVAELSSRAKALGLSEEILLKLFGGAI